MAFSWRGASRQLQKQIAQFKAAGEDSRRLAALVRDSNDAVTLLDFKGNILTWNRGAENMYGWSEAEALQRNIRDTVPGTEAPGGIGIR